MESPCNIFAKGQVDEVLIVILVTSRRRCYLNMTSSLSWFRSENCPSATFFQILRVSPLESIAAISLLIVALISSESHNYSK